MTNILRSDTRTGSVDMCLLRNDRNAMVNFKPGECLFKKMIFPDSNIGSSEEKIKVLPIGVKPTTFRIRFLEGYSSQTQD